MSVITQEDDDEKKKKKKKKEGLKKKAKSMDNKDWEKKKNIRVSSFLKRPLKKCNYIIKKDVIILKF